MLNRINKLSPGVLLLLIIAGVAACKKNIQDTTPRRSDFSNATRVQFFNAAVSTTRNAVYVDGVPVNYATIAYSGQFPAAPNTSFAVAPGIRSFQIKDTLVTSTQPAVTFSQNFQFNKIYTVFLYDTLNAVKQKTVETNIEIPADTSARLRFANFTYSPFAITAVDIFSKKKNAVIFTNVQVTDVTPFIPYPAGVNDTFYVRPTGTTVNLQNFVPTPTPGAWADILVALNPAQKRSYTLVFRGSYRAVTSTAATVRTLSTFINY